jgi:ABC-type nickel/cobalt efflux system permease component RcnA
MVGQLLLRGMLVGVVAALLAFGFAKTFGEPQIERAIAFERQMSHAEGGHVHGEIGNVREGHVHHGPGHETHAHAEHDEPELVSRTTQAGVGLLIGVVVYGAALGGLFSLTFAFANGRVGDLGARATAALLALGAFVGTALIPALKYPANPPAVGNPDTIGSRTALYFAMLAISIAFLAAAVVLARRLWVRHGGWNATLIAAAVFVVAIGLVAALLPTVDEVPHAFSATVLWRFRLASLGMQFVLWTTIGLLFGYLTERAEAPRPSRRTGAVGFSP